MRNADFLFATVEAAFQIYKEDSWEKLNKLRAPTAVLQHHDGVTGTSRRLVSDDYIYLLSKGIVFGEEVISEMLGQFVSRGSFDPRFTTDLTFLWKQLEQGETVPVVLFNSLSWRRNLFHNVTLAFPNVEVRDSQGQIVPSQVNPGVSFFFSTHTFLLLPLSFPPLSFPSLHHFSRK